MSLGAVIPSSPLHSFDRNLLMWLRQSTHWRSLPWRQRLQLGWRSYWATLNRRLSDQRHVRATAPNAPLLIAGPWRSGTTVMHELLHAATGWPTPLTWQCMNATAYQLLPPPSQSAHLARPMDGLAITATSPQEDEFGLLSLGVESAYRAFLSPSRISELHHTLDPAYWLASANDWMPRLERFMQGVLASSARPEARILLKSPNHSFRLPALLRRWPAAQVVWMVRDPAAVFHSNRKMWLAMFEAHALARDESTAGLDAFLAEALDRCAEVLEFLLTGPNSSVVVCAQEALQSDPRAEVAHVLRGLRIEQVAEPNALEAALASTASGRIEVYRELPLPAVAEAGVARLRRAQDHALQRAFNQQPNSGW